MLRKTIIALCSLAMLAATLAAPGSPAAQAQSDSGLRLIAELLVPNSNDVKFPHVVAGNNTVHVSGNANRTAAYVWTKAATANSFPAPVNLGPAEGQPDFSTTSIAKGPDGSIYAAWVNQGSRTIFMRQRNSAGSWGPTRTVDRGSAFPVKPEVGVSSNGQIFVAWRDPDRPIRYRFSSDGGVNWSSARNVSEDVAFDSPIGLAGGPNGAMAITFTAGAGGRLQIFVGLWNGGAFNVQRITTLSADYADSSVSIGPDGKVYAAWRGVAESGGNSGIFYSERAADGSWPRSRLAGGKITGTTSVNADETGNLHFTWLAQPGGENQIFYAFKALNAAPVGPVASGDGGALFNSRGFGSAADGAYNHVVSEEFTGAGLRTRYSLFQSNVITFGGEPVVENGIARARRNTDNAVAVTFRNVVGSPNQVRYAWNRVPANSDPWQPYSATIRVPVPEEILSSTTCEASTLYTQLRNTATNLVETRARSVTVQIDGVVEATVNLGNAYSRATAATAELTGVSGAPGGDPFYTRVPLVYLDVNALSDCNGLTTLSVGSSPNALETTYQMGASGFEGVVALPNLANLKPGPVPFTVQVSDGAGNNRNFDFTVTIDEDIPVLNPDTPGTVAASPDRKGDVLQDLILTNINLRDATYRATGDADPNRQFWGVWLANAIEPVSDPASQLTWTVIKAPPSVAVPNVTNGGTDYRVTIQDWSLTIGLTPDQRVPGEDYFVYVRFLDGAGNPTEKILRIDIPVSQLDRVDVYAPLVIR